MKIAFVNDTFLEGRGADTVIYELAKRLGKRHEVFVIAVESDLPEDNFKILKIDGRKLLSGNAVKDSFSYFPNLIRLRKEINRLHKKYGFDVINVHHSSLNPAFKGLPVVVTWHGTPPCANKLRTAFNKFVLRSLRRNILTITISNYMKKELSKTVPGKRIKKVYNGIDKDFKPTYRDKEFMFFAGRMEEHKGIKELIKLSKDLNFPLHIAGSGPLESSLREYAKEISSKKVKFLGKVSRKELINEYQECSFFVSASKWEGFGLIFVEAGACAKPSVGYKKGSIPEVILDKETGFTVNDYQELRRRSKILLEDKKLRSRMGKKALMLSRKFSWDKSSEEYEGVFMRL